MSEDEDVKVSSKVKDYKNKVKINKHAPTQTETVDFHGAFDGFDNSFDLEEFKKNLKIEIQSLTKDELVFDMIGIDAPIANAFRRIMISEVPTIAIEKVVIVNNTSIIQDEVLAHRIGLVPIKVDPRYFIEKPKKDQTDDEPIELDNEQLLENETLLFKLDVSCTKNPKQDESNPYIDSIVKSSQLKWIPFGQQKKELKEVKPVHDDIVLAKLRPGQKIHLECYAEKGIGKTHSKWSPVSTAFYRILPEIKITKKFDHQKLGKKLVEKCPMKVFDIEDDQVIVKKPRDCTMCRECIRDEGWENYVNLSRIKDHFIFSIESVGIYSPEEIFREALRIFYKKVLIVKNDLSQNEKQSTDEKKEKKKSKIFK